MNSLRRALEVWREVVGPEHVLTDTATLSAAGTATFATANRSPAIIRPGNREEDQAFYVLEGEHEFVCGGRTFTAGTGSFVYVPRGTTHSYENVGTEPGRLLILSTPAGGTERLFFDLGEPAAEGSPPPATELLDLQSFRATVQSYGSDIDLFALLRQWSAGRFEEQDAPGRPV